jgi:6-pyruvoyl tetrahydropterin synthase/QueD family protein
MVLLTRKIEFAASHLYHNPDFSPEENRRIFGKCNNPHGHGHNYTLEVTVAGEPDPVTGMVLDLKDLKDILDREVMQRMDHRFLNYEVGARRFNSDVRKHARVFGTARSADQARKVAPRAALRNAGSLRGLLCATGRS